MNTYRLLRNNQESGPFSLNQLLENGLKPYDLIWVEGKSAGWRYSSEIDELKEHAPVVEEQPFERFYKKPGSEKHKHELKESEKPVSDKEVNPGASEQQKSPIERNKQEPGIIQPEKAASHIYISLPGKKGKSIHHTIPKEKTVPVSSSKKEIEKTENINVSIEKKGYANPEIARKAIESKYGKKITGLQFPALAKYASAAVYILILGGLIYFAVRPDKQFENSNPESLSDINRLNTNFPLENNSPADLSEDNTANNGEQGYAVSDENLKALPEEVYKKKDPLKKTAAAVTEENTGVKPDEVIPPAISTNDENGTRNRMVRGDKNATEPENVKGLREMISVKANDYKRKALGGIKNLELTVRNSSPYILNTVTVELNYLKPSEQTLMSDTIHFRSVAPNGSMTIKIPDQARGIKVDYRIIEVESTQYDKTTAGL